MTTRALLFMLVLSGCDGAALDSPDSETTSHQQSAPPKSRFPCGNTTCDSATEYCSVEYICYVTDAGTNPEYACTPLPDKCAGVKDPCACTCKTLDCVDDIYTGPLGPSLDSASAPNACMIDFNCV